MAFPEDSYSPVPGKFCYYISMFKKQSRYSLLLFAAAAIWGFAFTAQRIGADYVDPLMFLACRSWLAFIVIFLFRKIRRPAAEDWKTLCQAGLVCGSALFIASILQQIAIPMTTTARAGFLTAMYVVIVPLLTFFTGSRISWRTLLAVVLSVAGLYLLCMNGSLGFGKGELLLILGAFFFALQIIAVNHYIRLVDGVSLSMAQVFVSAALSTVILFASGRFHTEGLREALPSLLYAGILSGGVAYTFQTLGQKNVHPTLASIIMCLESVFSALGGWLILHQAMNLKELCGAGLMFIAVLLASLS